jgi:hypothetical protein
MIEHYLIVGNLLLFEKYYNIALEMFSCKYIKFIKLSEPIEKITRMLNEIDKDKDKDKLKITTFTKLRFPIGFWFFHEFYKKKIKYEFVNQKPLYLIMKKYYKKYSKYIDDLV